ncbi:hypothetical protein [Glycomyces salinus]|uniref:hypothetical protein n=1 Tax=Glycomyces salinus TaxID=980294 RepID=UPI0018EAA9F1|nr:hypothetical protein [Glycomyces salinus]
MRLNIDCLIHISEMSPGEQEQERPILLPVADVGVRLEGPPSGMGSMPVGLE